MKFVNIVKIKMQKLQKLKKKKKNSIPVLYGYREKYC